METNDALIKSFLISRKGASTTSLVSKHIQSRRGISDDAARKAVNRNIARGLSNILKGLFLKSGSQVIFLPKTTKKMSLYNAILNTNSSYGEALRVLSASNGGLPLNIFKAHSSLTVKTRKGRILFSKAVEVLDQNRLIRIDEDIIWGPYCYLDYDITKEKGIADSQLTVESIFLENISDWIAKTNMGSFDKVEIRTKNTIPEFAGYAWDLVAPSYLNGLTSWQKKKPKPGFIVGDVWLNKSVSIHVVKYFLDKVDSVRSNIKNRPMIPVFMFNNVDEEALRALRTRGVMLIHVKGIFGQAYGKALLGIFNALENIQANVINHPAQTADLFKTVIQMGGANNNLKGALFEFIIARVCFHEGNYIIGIREKLKNQLNEVVSDIDVLGKKEKVKMVAYECKSLEKGKLYSLDDLQDWKKNTLPKLFNWIKEFNKKTDYTYRLEVCFCVSTDFHPDCLKLIESIENNVKKHKIRFLNETSIKKILDENNDKSIISVYDKILLKSVESA